MLSRRQTTGRSGRSGCRDRFWCVRDSQWSRRAIKVLKSLNCAKLRTIDENSTLVADYVVGRGAIELIRNGDVRSWPVGASVTASLPSKACRENMPLNPSMKSAVSMFLRAVANLPSIAGVIISVDRTFSDRCLLCRACWGPRSDELVHVGPLDNRAQIAFVARILV